MPATPSRFGAPARRLGAWWWTLRGRRRLRAGEVKGAVAAFQRALAHRPDRFRTLVDLSIAHLIAREIQEAQVALGQARRVDPAGFDHRAGRLLARWGFEIPRVHTQPRPRPAVKAASRTRFVTAQAHPFGDCQDLDEYARFRAMPPITPAEIEGVDWDRVIGDLFED